MQYNLQIHDIIAYIMPALQMLWKLVCVYVLIVCINFVFVQFIVHVFDTVIANVICNYITMPGVVHHELSHAVAAFIFGAKIKKIRILPNKDSLGEVFIQPQLISTQCEMSCETGVRNSRRIFSASPVCARIHMSFVIAASIVMS